jgi:hypothetical protein
MGNCLLKQVEWRSSQSTAKPDFCANAQQETAFNFPPAIRLAALGADLSGKLSGNCLPYLDLPCSSCRRNLAFQRRTQATKSSNGVQSPGVYSNATGLKCNC